MNIGGKRLVEMVFGKDFLNLPVPNLQKVILDDTPSTTPVLMCALPGFDPSGQVHELVTKLNKTAKALALGSPEAYDLAEKAINSGAKEVSKTKTCFCNMLVQAPRRVSTHISTHFTHFYALSI